MIWLYRIVLYPLARLIFWLAAPFNHKIRDGMRLRRTIRTDSRARGGVWIHCASGEFEYAKPVIQELKNRDPKIKIGVTYFSPSVRRSLESFPLIDDFMPSPLDTPHHAAHFLSIAQPRAFLIARTDLWPELLYQCRARGIPTVLFAATLSDVSGRMHPLARGFYRWVTGLLTRLVCVSESDRSAFHHLAPQVPCEVLGDTRFDQVLKRLESPKPVRHELKPEHFTLVAGSTWPEDEAVVIEAFRLIHAKLPQARLILVPHEPTPMHLGELELRLKHFSFVRYSSAKATDPWDVLVVDQVGILAELYTWGQIAIVGGSFRKSVHSVMEPLAAGLLTLVGPYHRNNREAQQFAQIPIASTHMVSVVANAPEIAALSLRLEELRQWPELARDIIARVRENANSSGRFVDSLVAHHELQFERTSQPVQFVNRDNLD